MTAEWYCKKTWLHAQGRTQVTGSQFFPPLPAATRGKISKEGLLDPHHVMTAITSAHHLPLYLHMDILVHCPTCWDNTTCPDKPALQVVHVDYSICFDRGQRLRVPERVPFRISALTA